MTLHLMRSRTGTVHIVREGALAHPTLTATLCGITIPVGPLVEAAPDGVQFTHGLCLRCSDSRWVWIRRLEADR